MDNVIWKPLFLYLNGSTWSLKRFTFRCSRSPLRFRSKVNGPRGWKWEVLKVVGRATLDGIESAWTVIWGKVDRFGWKLSVFWADVGSKWSVIYKKMDGLESSKRFISKALDRPFAFRTVQFQCFSTIYFMYSIVLDGKIHLRPFNFPLSCSLALAPFIFLPRTVHFRSLIL